MGCEYARISSPRTSRVRIALVGGLALLVLIPSFVSLGMWQWRKAEIKTQTQAELDARGAQASVELTGAAVDASRIEFRRVHVRGQFDATRQVLIDNRIHNEEAGYHVITPLRIDGSDSAVLINRGWIAAPADHGDVPAAAAPTGTVELTGVAVIPSARFFTLAAQPKNGWAPVWQNLDLERYRTSVAYPLQPVVVLLDPGAPAGFARDWPRPDDRTGMHRGYALQWFGFALASVGIWLFFLLRPARAPA
jgi:surfeit locus 1 family protein